MKFFFYLAPAFIIQASEVRINLGRKYLGSVEINDEKSLQSIIDMMQIAVNASLEHIDNINLTKKVKVVN